MHAARSFGTVAKTQEKISRDGAYTGHNDQFPYEVLVVISIFPSNRHINGDCLRQSFSSLTIIESALKVTFPPFRHVCTQIRLPN